MRKGVSKAAALLEVMPALAATRTTAELDYGDGSPCDGSSVNGSSLLDGSSAEGAAEEPRAIFVDDTVKECCDERMAELKGVYRVLFRRGGVL